MELEEFFLYLLSCECGRPIQNLTDIDQPSWWPSEVTFKENLLEILSEEEVKLVMHLDNKVNSNSSGFSLDEFDFEKSHSGMLFIPQIRYPARIQ